MKTKFSLLRAFLFTVLEYLHSQSSLQSKSRSSFAQESLGLSGYDFAALKP